MFTASERDRHRQAYRAKRWCRAPVTLLVLILPLFAGGCATSGSATGQGARSSASGATVPAPVQAVLSEARQLVARGEMGAALVVLGTAQETVGYHASLNLETGQVFEALGETTKAREEYEGILLRDMANAEALIALGLLHLRENRNELAEQRLRQAVGLDQGQVRQSTVQAYNGLGVIADRRGDYESASAWYLRALEIHKSPLLYNNLGYSRYLSGNHGAAEWAYLQALELSPGYRAAVMNLALLKSKLGQGGSARELLDSVDAEAGDYARLGLDRAADIQAGRLQAAKAVPDEAPRAELPVVNGGEAEATAEPSTGIVFARLLRIRESGSADAEIVGWLKQGAEVVVLEESDGWSFVEYDTGIADIRARGWVASRYVRKPAA